MIAPPNATTLVISIGCVSLLLTVALMIEQIMNSTLQAEDKILRIISLLFVCPVGMMLHLECPPPRARHRTLPMHAPDDSQIFLKLNLNTQRLNNA